MYCLNITTSPDIKDALEVDNAGKAVCDGGGPAHRRGHRPLLYALPQRGDRPGHGGEALGRTHLRPGGGGRVGRPVVDLFETGIKVIDLLAPYARGGKIGLFGGAGVGKNGADPGADP